MKHADWCRSRQPQGFCNCKPKPAHEEVWHNVTTEALFKSLIPGWKAAEK